MDISLMLKALGEPMRYKIFTLLTERKHCVRSLSRKLSISESAVSQHLKIMREAGLIHGEKFGHHIHYIPNRDAVAVLSGTFSSIASHLEAHIDEPNICNCSMKEENE